MSTTAPLLGVASHSEVLGGGKKWTCQDCTFLNDEDVTEDAGYDSEEDSDVEPEDPPCLLCRLFDTLLLLSGRKTRSGREDFVRAADVVTAFKMYQFRSSVSEFAFIAQMDRERQALGRFKQMFGKVVLLAHDRYGRVTTTSGLWTVPTARRRFTRQQFAQLWMCITDPMHQRVAEGGLFSAARAKVQAQLATLDLGLKTGPGAVDEADGVKTLEALKQLGGLECVQLTDMFFGCKLDRVVDRINTNVLYFDTLMMHIEVNTMASDVNGTIAPEEFYEGLHLLGVPQEHHKPAMLHFHDYTRALGQTELTGPLFRILCLYLCSPSAPTNKGNITDMKAGADRKRRVRTGRPAGSVAASVARGAAGLSPMSVADGDRSITGGGYGEAKASSVASGGSAFTGTTPTYAMDEPAPKMRKVNWRMSALEMEDLRQEKVSLAMVKEFRQRLQFLFSSAEGNVRHIDWGAFWLTFVQLVILPFGMARMLYVRSKRVGFNFYYIFAWLIGVAYWIAIVIPVATYVSKYGCECVTIFEIFYPLATGLLCCFAISTYNGFYGVVLHPSTFRRLRLKYRLDSITAEYHYFETGLKETKPVLTLLESEHILPTKVANLLSDSDAFTAAFSDSMKRTMMGVTIFFSVLVALLPGTLRASPNVIFNTPQCGNFFGVTLINGSPQTASDERLHTMSTVCYAILAFCQTFAISTFLTRLYVVYARIARCFAKFTALIDRLDARKKRVGAIVSFADEEEEGITSGGRLSGYMDMRNPANVKAWSKMRVYMIQNFADQLGASEIFLAFFVLFGLLLALLCVAFVLVPPTVLSELDDPGQEGFDMGGWQWKTMAFLCGIVAAIIMIPVFLVLGYGVAINDSLASHRQALLKLKYTLIEEVSDIQAKHMGHDGGVGFAHAPRMHRLDTARRMCESLLDIIAFKDVKITILGVAITSTLIRTVFSSVAVAAASSVAKVLTAKK